MIRVVIIGSSITGHTVAQELRSRDKDCVITIVSAGTYPLYDRRALLDVLAGRVKEKQIFLARHDWYGHNNIVFMPGRKVSAVNTERRVVYFKEKGTLGYDFLVVTTGARWESPDIAGSRKPGIFSLQSLEDVKDFLNTVVTDPVCVVGAHDFALAVAGIVAQKYKAGVKLFAQDPIDPAMVPAGCEVFTARITEIIGEGRVQAVKTNEGKVLGVSAVLWMANARGNSDFLKNTVVEQAGGFILSDESARTNVERIYAAGSVTRLRGGARQEKDWDSCITEGSRLAQSLAAEMGQTCQT